MLEIIAEQRYLHLVNCHLLLNRPSQIAIVLSRIDFLRYEVFLKICKIYPLITNHEIGCQNVTSDCAE